MTTLGSKTAVVSYLLVAPRATVTTALSWLAWVHEGFLEHHCGYELCGDGLLRSDAVLLLSMYTLAMEVCA